MVLTILISGLATDLFVPCQALIISSSVSNITLGEVAEVQLPSFSGHTLWEDDYGKSVGCEG